MMIGPESTGKTTLSKLLSKQFNEPWVPEFARDYLTKINRPYIKEDLVEIAKGQIESEEKIQMRLDKAAYEISFSDQFNAVVKNEVLDTACKETAALIQGFISK